MTTHPPKCQDRRHEFKTPFVEPADAFMGSVATGASAAPFRIIAVE
ncbi:MAG TPA: hypothetical protein VEI81_01790 [Methanoregula sp.]|nr:hypothetical protein [Methanoregula sp.]